MASYIFTMQLEVAGFAVLIGACGYGLLFLIKGVEDYLYTLSLRMIFDDALFFLLSSSLVGILAIVFNHHIRVSETYEGV